MAAQLAQSASLTTSESKRQMPNVFSRAKSTRPDAGQAVVQTSRPIVGEQYRDVFLTAIVRDSPLQSRAHFDPHHDDEDQALMESLDQHGQRVPVQLAEIEGSCPPEYAILDGHRRIAALRHLGHDAVKAIIVRQGTLECDLISLTANVRKNLAPLELARTIDRLRRIHKMTTDAIARDAGISRQYVSSLVGLLEADPVLSAAVEAGHISATTARVLSQAPRELQPKLAEIAIASELSDAQARRLMSRIEATGEDPRQAGLALGFAVAAENQNVETGQDTIGHEKLESRTPSRRNSAPKRKGDPTLTEEAARAMLKDSFPRLHSEAIGALSTLAVQGSASRVALKVAGLLASTGKMPSEAMETARFVEDLSGTRKLVSVLDVCGEMRALIRAGRFQQKVAPMLGALARELEALEQQVAA